MTRIKVPWKWLYIVIFGKVLKRLPNDTNYGMDGDGVVITDNAESPLMKEDSQLAEGERGTIFTLPPKPTSEIANTNPISLLIPPPKGWIEIAGNFWPPCHNAYQADNEV